VAGVIGWLLLILVGSKILGGNREADESTKGFEVVKRPLTIKDGGAMCPDCRRVAEG